MPFLIMVNPFCVTTLYNLPLESYLEMIFEILQIPHVLCLVVTYGTRHEAFMQGLDAFKNSHGLKYDLQTFKKLLIFQNNDDILNLAEIISRVNLCISPSTGVIHIASNLDIPTIGIYSHYDTKKWATQDRRYVILPKPQDSLTPQDCLQAINSTLHLTKELMYNKRLLN